MELENRKYVSFMKRVERWLKKGGLPDRVLGFTCNVFGWTCKMRNYRLNVYRLVVSEEFVNFIMFMIFANSFTMAIEHHNQPESMTGALALCNVIFCVIFAMEMILKLMALGGQLYFVDPVNCFDAFIVVASIIDLTLAVGGGFSALRAIRVMRLFKMLRFFPTMGVQLNVIGAAVGELLSFCFLLLLYVFVFAILGMYLFGAKYVGTQSRANYDYFAMAMLTSFQITTGEVCMNEFT